MSRIFPSLVFLAPIVLLASCESTSTTKPADTAPILAPEAVVIPSNEDPSKRNDRLLRLEWSGDQWWVATQRQEWDKVAGIEKLIGDYVAQNFDLIVGDLKFGSPRHRRAMAFALGFSRRVEAVGPLVDTLKDTYYEVVLHSLLGLYQLVRVGDTYTMVNGKIVAAPLVVDPEWVLPHLKHPRAEVRSNAALVLSRIVGPTTPKGALLVIVTAVDDTDAATRVHAMAALGATLDREAFPYLVKGLRDSVELVRIRAALELGRIHEKDAVPYLINTLATPDEKLDVKRAAVKSLVELTGEKLDSIEADAWKPIAVKMGLLKG